MRERYARSGREVSSQVLLIEEACHAASYLAALASVAHTVEWTCAVLDGFRAGGCE